MRPSVFGSAASALLACMLASASIAQVVSDSNQITGSVRFSNVDPVVLSLLDAGEGMGSAWMEATSQPPAPPSTHLAQSDAGGSATRLTYTVTVEGSSAGTAYRIGADAALDGGRAHYDFRSRLSPPVFPEPAPDVVVDFEECVGLVRFHFFEQGSPLTADESTLSTSQDDAPGPTLFYSAREAGAVSGDTLVLPARATPWTVRVTVVNGGSSREVNEDVVVGCDAVVDVNVDVPPGSPGTPATIRGQLDVLGESERRIPSAETSYSRVEAFTTGAPWYDFIDGDPSAGIFEITDVPRSDSSVPPRDYDVIASTAVRSGTAYGEMDTCAMRVTANGPVDMGDTFVMQPATIAGSVRVLAPPTLPGRGPLLAHVRWRPDADGDGIPEPVPYEYLTAIKLNGADSVQDFVSGWEARSEFQFPAAWDDALGEFRGAHESLIVTPGNAPIELWGSELFLAVEDTTAPDPGDQVDYHVTLRERAPGPAPLIARGATRPQDFHYCFATVEIQFTATSGTLYLPYIDTVQRGRQLPDFEGRPVHWYNCSAVGYGRPWDRATAAPTGSVTLQLTPGRHELRPSFYAPQPFGPPTRSELPSFEIDVGCRQHLVIGTDVQLSLAADARPCAGSTFARASGSVASSQPIMSIGISLNGAPETMACSPCGMSPTYDIPLTLQPGDNEIRVHAVDGAGREATATGFTRVAEEPSALDLRPTVEPLRVRRSGSAALAFTWEARDASAGHALHQGTIASLHVGRVYDHVSVACNVTTAAAFLTMPATDNYFLVGASCLNMTASLGRDSFGAERPGSARDCP